MMRRGQIQLRGRLRWWLRRARLRRRVGTEALARAPIVFGNAIPKNGSTLLFNILRGLPQIGPFVDSGLSAIKPIFRGQPTSPAWIRAELNRLRPGDVRLGYLHATPENIALVCQPGWAPFLIHRDPRDSLVSGIFYALEIHTNHIMNAYYRQQDNMEQRITTAIYGIPEGQYRFADIRTIYERYLGWLDYPQVCVVRFEDLVADPPRQLQRILEHLQAHGLQLALPEEQALAILAAQMDPRKSDTYRKGRAGGWREHFTERNKAQFKEVTSDLLIRMGYERDMEW